MPFKQQATQAAQEMRIQELLEAAEQAAELIRSYCTCSMTHADRFDRVLENLEKAIKDHII